MSRLTGADAYSLMEAYQAVYSPQELTEEQVWEEVETWVNSLIEEGYDLSDYTWEEMYEEYITEIGVNFGGQKAVDAVNARLTQQKQFDSKLDALRNQRFAGSKLTLNKPEPGATPGRGFAGGNVTGGKVGPKIVGPKIVGPKIVGPKIVGPGRVGPDAAPAPRQQPATPPPVRTATPPGGTTKPTATATPTPAPSASPARPSLSSQADEIRQMRARSLQRQGKTLDAATVSGATRPAYQANSFDVFDVIKGHLIDEGYADTEESALVIMANMSEEWRQSIVEQDAIVRTGTSTNAAGEKIPWRHTHNSGTGKSSVTDKFGTRDVTVRSSKLKGV